MQPITENILNIIKGGSLGADDYMVIAQAAVKKMSPEIRQSSMMPVEVSPELPLSEERKRDFDAIYGIKTIAEARIKQLTKGHDLSFDSRQPDNLVRAAVYCLTQDPDFYPEDWNKVLLEKVLAMEDAERIAIAGAFVSAFLDVQEYERKAIIRQKQELKDMLGEPEEEFRQRITQQEIEQSSAPVSMVDLAIQRQQEYDSQMARIQGIISQVSGVPSQLVAVQPTVASIAATVPPEEGIDWAASARSSAARTLVRSHRDANAPIDWDGPPEADDEESYTVQVNARRAGITERAAERAMDRFIADVDAPDLPTPPPLPISDIPNPDELIARGNANIVEGDLELD